MKHHRISAVIFLTILVFLCGCTQTANPGTGEERTDTFPAAAAPPAGSSSDSPAQFPLVMRSENGTITIHSALKNTKIKSMNPRPGNILVVMNLTIENHAEEQSILVSRDTLKITNGGPVGNPVLQDLANPFSFGPIPPGNERTGEIVFGTNVSTEQFTITLRDEQGNLVLHGDIGTIPVGTYGEPTAPALNLTVYSAKRMNSIQGARPNAGHTFLVLDISIENGRDAGRFSFGEKNIRVTCDEGPGAYSINTKLGERVNASFPTGILAAGEVRRGNMVFGVPAGKQSFMVKLTNDGGQVVSNTIELNDVPVAEE